MCSKNRCVCPLTELKGGCSAYVTCIKSQGTIRRRLRDIGLIEGTCIKCVFKSPSGDPAAYLIRGAVIAIRYEDAQNILIKIKK